MKIVKYFLVACFAMFISSCMKVEVETPEACCETFTRLQNGTLQQQSSFKKGESVVFKACSPATQYAIWTGDPGFNFDLNHGGTGANKGVAFQTNDGTFEYKYPVAGTFKVVFIATNTVYAGDIKQSTLSFNITITD